VSAATQEINFETTPFLLHVGLHKCASTWLQAHFFENPATSLHAPWGGMAHHAVTEFISVDPLHFSAQTARANLAAVARPAPPATTACVLSHEALSSRPWQGSYYAPYVAKRLRATFGNARILLVFREQRALIHSLYGQYIRNNGRLTLREFLGTSNDPPGFSGLCKLDFFCYDRLITMYREVFGADRVLALPLEMLARQPEQFVDQISGFLDIPAPELPTGQRVNTASRAFTYELFRRSNTLIRPDALRPQTGLALRARHKALSVLDRLIPDSLHARADTRWREAIRLRAGDHFQASNTRTAAILGLDLGALGYDMSPDSEVKEPRDRSDIAPETL
jgi:hypothetical protein